jgi:hypothetical protein
LRRAAIRRPAPIGPWSPGSFDDVIKIPHLTSLNHTRYRRAKREQWVVDTALEGAWVWRVVLTRLLAHGK